MAEPFTAEIRIWACDYAPSGWAFCDGSLMSIPQNTELFSILGTTFGGNGTTTFGLPQLRDRVPVCAGKGPGLSEYDMGEVAGCATVTLNAKQIPSHSHGVGARETRATLDSPAKAVLANSNAGDGYVTQTPTAAMDPGTIGPFFGQSQPHNNLMPFLGLNFCIAIQGIYPKPG